MKTIAFAPQHNTFGKKDASGAFQPEARRFGNIHKAQVVHINNHFSQQTMSDIVIYHICSFKNLELVAFFCHGTNKKIQLGFNIANIDLLAKAITTSCEHYVTVVLYCCLTGSGSGVGGDNGFADKLRDSLCINGITNCRVVAHTTAGHTTKNPYVRFFDGMGSPVGGTGGYYPVPPHSKMWKTWINKLRNDETFRYRMPIMSINEIYQELTEV